MFTIGLPALLSASVQNILFLVLGQSGGDSAELVPSVPLLALGARPEESHPTALGRGLGMWWEGDGGDMPLRGRDSLGPALAELRFSNFWRLLRVLTLILEHRNAGKDNCKIKFRFFFLVRKQGNFIGRCVWNSQCLLQSPGPALWAIPPERWLLVAACHGQSGLFGLNPKLLKTKGVFPADTYCPG